MSYYDDGDSDEFQYLPLDVCDNLLSRVFQRAGLCEYSLRAVVDGLLFASLRGIDSHGIKLAPHYAACAASGIKNPSPVFTSTAVADASFRLNADGAFGLAAGKKAVEIGLPAADAHGISVVSVKNSTHPAAVSAVLAGAARKGYVCIGAANADSLMASYGGHSAFFGTNPISFCAPMGDSIFTLDMATTHFTWNKVKIYRQVGKDLPSGVAVDSEGLITTDPEAAVALVPTGGHKGFALAAMVEILCSALSGSLISHDIKPMYSPNLDAPRDLSQLYIFISEALAGPAGVLSSRVRELSERLIAAEPHDTQVTLPGIIEDKIEENRRKNGLPVDNITYSALVALAEGAKPVG